MFLSPLKLLSQVSLFCSLFSIAPHGELVDVRAQGKCPIETFEPKACQKAIFDMSTFTSIEEYWVRHCWCSTTLFWLSRVVYEDGRIPSYYSSELIFSTLLHTLYSKMRFSVGGPISCTLRVVEINLGVDVICCILGVLVIRLRVYEFKT